MIEFNMKWAIDARRNDPRNSGCTHVLETAGKAHTDTSKRRNDVGVNLLIQ